MTLKLAMIGMGWAGTRQTQAVRELNRDIEVVALVDNDRKFLEEKAAELGVSKVYTTLEDALADPQVNAISICTPHHLHCQMALAAARSGKHILVEKPIALTVEDATQMIDAADENRVVLFVAESLVYTSRPPYLRKLVQEQNLIGAITAVAMVAGFRSENFVYAGRRDWLTRPEIGGTGTWMLHGVHSMAELRHIFGEVESIYLREHKTASFQRKDIEGTVTGILNMANGLPIAIVQSSETRLPGNLGGYLIYGERGSIRAGKTQAEIFLADSQTPDMPQLISYPQPELSEYALEIQAFAECVQTGKAGITSGRSERRSLAVVQAGYESIQQNVPVNLRERFGDI